MSDRGVHEGLREPAVAEIERKGGATVVTLAGELDLYNAQEIREALFAESEAGPERIVVDLSRVDFIDSTALGALIESRSKLADRRAFLLAAPALETRRALEVSGLDRHFTLFDTVDEALAATL